jgi:hypothetical protein
MVERLQIQNQNQNQNDREDAIQSEDDHESSELGSSSNNNNIISTLEFDLGNLTALDIQPVLTSGLRY